MTCHWMNWVGYLLLALLYLSLMQTDLPVAQLVVLKVLPIALLLSMAIRSSGAPRYLMIALVFSGCGDVLLSLPLENGFLIGLGAFLIAQLTYAWGFWSGRMQPMRTGAGLRILVLVLYLVGFGTWLLPQTGEMMVAVGLYMAAIATMAVSAARHRSGWLLYVGAAVFVISDSIIAVERFAAPFEGSRYAVMGTYYFAQGLISFMVLKDSALQRTA